MFGILITDGRRNYSVLNSDNEIVATTMGSMFTNGKLCPKNCRTVACGYDFDKSVEYFDKGKMYIQQDGVIVLAGENRTDGIIVKDPLGSRGVGHYAVDWNPKAFNEYDSNLKVLEMLSDKKYDDGDVIQAINMARRVKDYSDVLKCESGDYSISEENEYYNEDQIIKSINQQGLEVEIVTELNLDGKNAIERSMYIPKFDVNGCLILKRK